MIENTSKRDPLLHVIGAMGNPAGYITDMEAAGQQQFVTETRLMPAEGDWDTLQALGFGAPTPTADELFVNSTLPEGWSKGATEHDMHSSVLDERGIERVGVFYKAAFYDRRASCYVANVGHRFATKVIYGDEKPALPDKWAVLTGEEREDFVDSLQRYLDDAEVHPDIYGHRVGRVKAAMDLAMYAAGGSDV